MTVESYDIEIRDSTLNEYGFTKFTLPLLNGKGNSIVTICNENSAKIIYCPLDRLSYDRSAKLLDEKLLSLDGEEIDHDVAIALATYLKNEYKLLREDKSSGFFNGNGNRKQQQQQQGEREEEDEDERLAAENKLSSQDIAFVIGTIKKEAEHDEISIKQLFYGMASAFTKVPIPHIVYSKDPGAGKSYLLELVSIYFPEKYVIVLSGMSNKALLHREGVLVLKNKETLALEPIAPIIKDLESEAEELDEQVRTEQSKQPPSSFRDKDLIKQCKHRINEINSEIKDIKTNASKLIDLSNQIILCLDTPQDSVYDVLMSLISQDTSRDQQYSFVEKSDSGKIGTKNNIVRGMPVLFSTQVIDDSRSERFAEKNRRFVNVTPDTGIKKIGTAKSIIGLKYGSLPEEYDALVVSRDDRDRAKELVKILTAKLKQHSKDLQSKEVGVRIPFVRAVTDSIPSAKVWSMTVVERMMKYISIIAKVNMDSRPKLVNSETGQIYPIATFEDLKEALRLMERGANSLRPYLLEWFNLVLIPSFKSLDGKPNEYKDYEYGTVIIREKRAGLTTDQLAEKTKEVFKITKPSSMELLHKYLYPLINQGVVDSTTSEINRKHNIYFPVEDEEQNLNAIFADPGDPKLKVPSPDIFPSKNVLKAEFGILSERCYNEGVKNFKKNFSKYKLVDADGETEITVDELLDRYFGNPEEAFTKAYGYNSSSSMLDTMVKAAVTSNIVYQQQVIQIQKNLNFSPFGCSNIRTEIPKNDIEDSIASYAIENIAAPAKPDLSKGEDPANLELVAEPKAKGSFKCFYCDECFDGKDGNECNIKRVNHMDIEHPGKPHYPSDDAFNNRLQM